MEGGGASVAGCVLRNATRPVSELFIPLPLLLSCSPVIPLSGCRSPIELLVRSPQALLSSEEFIRSDCPLSVSWPGRQFAVHKAKDWLIVLLRTRYWASRMAALSLSFSCDHSRYCNKNPLSPEMLFWLWYTNNCLWNSWQVELWPEPLFNTDIYFADFHFTMVLYLPSVTSRHHTCFCVLACSDWLRDPDGSHDSLG